MSVDGTGARHFGMCVYVLGAVPGDRIMTNTAPQRSCCAVLRKRLLECLYMHLAWSVSG